MLQDFKVQVQEWKNGLLRGKDSAQRERYWAAFQKQERIVAQDASQLLAELPPGPALDKVRAFSQALERMGAAWPAVSALALAISSAASSSSFDGSRSMPCTALSPACGSWSAA